MESSGTSLVFFIGLFRRERGHRYIGVYWWAVDRLEFGESCVSWIRDRSNGVGIEVFVGCFCGAGSSEIGKV